MRIRSRTNTGRAELQLTSMIDVVFLLLIFFVMTFKIAAQEGDFSVRMPLASQGNSQIEENLDLPIKLRLRAAEDGSLADIVVNDNRSFGTDFASLRDYVLRLAGGEGGPANGEGPEVEIDLDYNLRYEHVIGAITAVTGYRDANDEVLRLVERIKFAPVRQPAESLCARMMMLPSAASLPSARSTASSVASSGRIASTVVTLAPI